MASNDRNVEVLFSDIANEESPFSKAEIKWDELIGIYNLMESHNHSNVLKPVQSHLDALSASFGHYHLPLFQGLSSIAFLVVNIIPELMNGQFPTFKLNLVVNSIGLPIGAGLGSSASFSVALSGCLMLLRKRLLQEDLSNVTVFQASPVAPKMDELSLINSWSYSAEMIIHGKPSGLDNTTSCLG